MSEPIIPYASPNAPEPLRTPSRRQFLIGVGGIGGLALLAACGSDASTAATTEDTAGVATTSAAQTATTDSSSASVANSASTRSFVDVRGKPVIVPDKALRIVAIHDYNGGAQLLSLGAPVVGIAGRAEGLRPDITRYFDLDGIELLSDPYEPNIEKIAALHPDLIVGEGYAGAGMDQFFGEVLQGQLEALAPVVYIDTFRPVEDVMADFVELVGGDAGSTLAQQKDDLDATVEELRAVLGDEWKQVTVSYVGQSGEGLAAWGTTSLPFLGVLDRLGVDWIPLMHEADEPANGGGIFDISAERMPEFSGDLVLVDVVVDDTILSQPLFEQLPAVLAGQVVELKEYSAGSHYPNYQWNAESLLAAITQLDLRTDIV